MATTTISHAASASQKKTSDTVTNERCSISAAMVQLAAEYMPSGKTNAHHTPAKCSISGRWLIWCKPK